MEYTKDMLDEVLREYMEDAESEHGYNIRVECVKAIRRHISELEEKAWMYDGLCK